MILDGIKRASNMGFIGRVSNPSDGMRAGWTATGPIVYKSE
jgi:hypothetical protein